jgi:hypothetical protein
MAGAIILALFVGFFVAVYFYQRRRKSRRDAWAGTMTVFAQAPTSPAQPATAWMFPGRSQPPDPDPRRTASTVPDPHGARELPPGVRKTDSVQRETPGL